MYTIDIDVGGTLTDGLFGDGQQLASVKVDTTPHDLTVCFLDCLQAGADQLGFDDLASLLARTQLIRWSTTITTNVLAEQRGPRLGLFVSGGHEHDLYDGNGSGSALELLGADNVIGLPQPVDQQAVLGLVKSLLERGVRRVCISLAGAFNDASDETRLKETIERQYPDHYLGAVPVLLGSDICKHPDDMTRTHYALINAYVHGPLADTLFKAEDKLRDEFGWKRQLLIGHQNGGVARVAKTRAVDTIESGPTMGLFASANFARRYRQDQVIALDVGGTTTKISPVTNGAPTLNYEPDVFGIPLKTPVPDVFSIALGGGSVAHVDADDEVRLGPESMGAYPGPACYDLGGTEATFTDAALVLGYLNPDNFLGGTRFLSVDSAREAIQTHVAGPLGVAVEEAATKIVHCAFDMVAESIKDRLGQAGQPAADCTLFAYGGNGAIFATGVAEQVGLESAYVFDLGSVFSVLGSSLADIMHVYEHALMVSPDEDGLAKLNQALIAMRHEAMRDMEGEGLDPSQVQLALDLDVKTASGEVVTTSMPLVATNGSSSASLRGVGRTGLDAVALKDAGVNGTIELARLRATYAVGSYEPEAASLGSVDASAARIGSRPLHWNGASMETAIYNWADLTPGNIVSGPAVIEGASTTYLVGPGWQLGKDEFANGHLTRKAD
ncbi:MAG: hydantoinase/oxoprolinase family protein [Anaerolineae bacterium]